MAADPQMVDVGFACHPAQVTDSELHNIHVPFGFAVAETDPQYPPAYAAKTDVCECGECGGCRQCSQCRVFVMRLLWIVLGHASCAVGASCVCRALSVLDLVLIICLLLSVFFLSALRRI